MVYYFCGVHCTTTLEDMFLNFYFLCYLCVRVHIYGIVTYGGQKTVLLSQFTASTFKHVVGSELIFNMY